MATSKIKRDITIIEIPYSNFTWDEANKYFIANVSFLSNLNLYGFIVRATNGAALLNGYLTNDATRIAVMGVVPKTMTSDISDYTFRCYAVCH